MFLHLSVILFTGGVWQTPQADTWGPWQTPPTQTPPGRHPLQTPLPLGRHPSPQADTPPGQTCPRQTQTSHMATAEDSMHPTGMNSCYIYKSICPHSCKVNAVHNDRTCQPFLMHKSEAE